MNYWLVEFYSYLVLLIGLIIFIGFAIVASYSSYAKEQKELAEMEANYKKRRNEEFQKMIKY